MKHESKRIKLELELGSKSLVVTLTIKTSLVYKESMKSKSSKREGFEKLPDLMRQPMKSVETDKFDKGRQITKRIKTLLYQ